MTKRQEQSGLGALRMSTEPESIRVWFPVGNDGFPLNGDVFAAYVGFMRLCDFGGPKVLPQFYRGSIEELLPGDIVCSGVFQTRNAFRRLGFKMPEWNDYPASLDFWMGREVHHLTLGDAFTRLWHRRAPFFVKPRHVSKAFDGQVLRTMDDFAALLHIPEETPIYLCECISFVSEWRVYLKDGFFLDAKPYQHTGLPLSPHWPTIIHACTAFRSGWRVPPAFCALDFGVTEDERTLLVEANDGYAIGCYDLDPVKYASGLLERWRQIELAL